MQRLRTVLTLSPLMIFVCQAAALAQLSSTDIAALRQQAGQEGWTFQVDQNPATHRSLKELCGVKEPDDWQAAAPRLAMPQAEGGGDLPATLDWRALGGCTPIRNQGGCGSCWAFSTVGALESAIKIMDGVEVDLSEQWLLSCNVSGWDCDGGWFAHDYHMFRMDACGGVGAVLESAFPYVADDEVPCTCGYEHVYLIDSWGYVGSPGAVPPTEAIKQAIMTYGPVSAMVYAGPAFQGYSGGVFNADSPNPINHGIVLVGWDDTQGTEGVWILRNSWGDGWGEDGYMLIEYGCCSVGYAASSIEYPGHIDLDVSPDDGWESDGPVGGPFTPESMTYTLTNTGDAALSWTATPPGTWLAADPNGGDLDPNESVVVTVGMTDDANSLAMGVYSGEVTFQNVSSGKTQERPITLRVGQPDYFTEEVEPATNDFLYQTVTFTPDGSNSFYTACATTTGTFPVDPEGGTVLPLGDLSFTEVTVQDGKELSLYGQSYGSFFVASNGYVTFGSGDALYSSSPEDHFSKPRISGLFKYFNPNASGTISWKQLSDRVVVTWQDMAEWTSTQLSNFQIAMGFDGTISITCLTNGSDYGLIGLSEGLGLPTGFSQSDLSGYASCERPLAYDASAGCQINNPATLVLTGTDNGLPDPPGALSYVITSLPTSGTLTDPGAGDILAVPYTLTSYGQQVTYTPAVNWTGTDAFTFVADDGTTPAGAGESLIATASITVGQPTTLLEQGFEGPFEDGAPAGWTKAYKTGTNDWLRNDGDQYVPGPHGGLFNALLFSYGSDETYLITPEIELGDRVSDLVVEFWHKQAGWFFVDALTVVARTDPNDPWTTLASYTVPASTWTKRTVSLPNTSGTVTIGFLGHAQGGDGLCIDDVVVHARPQMALDLAFVNGSWGDVLFDPEPNDANDPVFEKGTLVTLTAVPIEGKAFAQWEIYDPNHPGDANYAAIDTNATITLLMDGPQSCTATFECGSGIAQGLPLLVVGLVVCGMISRRLQR